MHSDISQSSTCSSSRLTLYAALFEVKLQFVKVPASTTQCRLLHPANKSTEPPNHIPHTHTHTHKQQSVHACIHSFIHSIHHIHSITLSQERTKHHHCHSSQSSSINHQPCIARTTQYGIRTCTHDVTMTRTQWNGMHLHAYRLPTTTLQRYIHTYMHACIEMTTSSHPLNVLMSIFGGGGGGGGGDIDHRVGTAASLLLRVDS